MKFLFIGKCATMKRNLNYNRCIQYVASYIRGNHGKNACLRKLSKSFRVPHCLSLSPVYLNLPFSSARIKLCSKIWSRRRKIINNYIIIDLDWPLCGWYNRACSLHRPYFRRRRKVVRIWLCFYRPYSRRRSKIRRWQVPRYRLRRYALFCFRFF